MDARRDYIKGHEKLELELYPDSLGYPTIGWGHLCVKRELTKITLEQAEEIFDRDYAEADIAAHHIFPEIDAYSENRQMALLDMSFQLSYKLTHFPQALAHVKNQNWPLAVADFLDSIWAKKETPRRAIDNAILLLEG